MYSAPLSDQIFALIHSSNIADILSLPAFDQYALNDIETILKESAKLAEREFAPINRAGDMEGARLINGTVNVPQAFGPTYQQFVHGGWATVGASADPAGLRLPLCVIQAINEQFTSANGALTGCMQLTWGAIEAIATHASEDLKSRYLPKLISGQWAGTMNLTEPQAGTDVGALKTRAVQQPDGSYRIKGQKIFISYGDHEMCENIIHLVLARTPGSPPGSKGISLFLVPKWIPDDETALGRRNDVHCISIEHKLGQHGAPTCTMIYGDNDACTGYLIGAENDGMRAMFTMMNNARLNVGIQGLSYAERAHQEALDYAQNRVQSRALDGGAEPVTIIRHPDVRRMLLSQRAKIEGVRALLYYTAAAIDIATAHPDHMTRAAFKARADLLTPIAKAFATDMGCDVTSSAIQVFGGVGFIEETGVAQHYRDVRITPIYEGTNGIQALDLVNRKLGQGGGAHWQALLETLQADLNPVGETAQADDSAWPTIQTAMTALENVTAWMAKHGGTLDAAAGATPYLNFFGTVICAALLAKQANQAAQAIAAGTADSHHAHGKITTARFYAEQILPPATALSAPIMAGNALLQSFGEEKG